MEILFKLLKLLYPFIKSSILGNDSLLTALRKRKIFLVVVVTNITMFLMVITAAEQGLFLIDRLVQVKSELAASETANTTLALRNVKLTKILKGDLDAICTEYFSVEYKGPASLDKPSTTNDPE